MSQQQILAEDISLTDTQEKMADAVVEHSQDQIALETKAQDDLADIKSAVQKVQDDNAILKADLANALLNSATLASDLEAKAAQVEEMEAKASAPMLNLKSKDKQKMDTALNHVKTFMVEGLEGLRAKAADLQIGVDAQGGYSLPEELRTAIIALEHEQSPIRQEVSVTSASTTDVKQLISIGNAASGWVGETSARAQTNAPELAQRTATFGEVYARPRIYQHMLEDAMFGAEAWLAAEVSRQFAEAENLSFLTGNGTNKPVGILNGLDVSASAAANDTTGVYQVINHGTDGALGADDTGIIDNIRSVVLSCKTGYLIGAKFMMNRATHNVLVSLKDANGSYYINRDIASAGGAQLFGFDIVINDDMADIPVSTGASAPILFGNFKRAYQIIDLTGVSMLRDPYTTPGSVMFYTRKRVGSMILDASALKVVGVSKS